MKNLSKALAVLMFCLLSAGTFAQTFGVKAGLNLSNMIAKDDDDNYDDDYKIRPGFHIGGYMDYALSDMLS